MEFLEKLFKKRFRVIYQDVDVAFEKNKEINFVDEEDVDDTFYTFGLIPVKNTVMYSLILPAAAEENLKEIVENFVAEKEPSDVSLKIDFSFVKDKGKLKVLIGVIKEEDYRFFREEFYKKSHTLSGIIPYQMLLIAQAIQNGVKEGVAVFKQDDYLLAFVMKNGFPVSFLKYKGTLNHFKVVERFVSAERLPEDTEVCFFGDFDKEEGLPENYKFVKGQINLVSAFEYVVSSKNLPQVNFLPVKERKVIRRWWRYIAAAIVIVAVLFYGGSFLKDYFKLRNEVKILRENFNAKKKQAMELRKKTGNLDELKEKVSYFKKLEKEKRKMLLLLEELTRKIPQTAYLTRVNINQRGDIELNGKAKDVYAVVKALNNSKYFKNVEKKSSRESGDYTIFIIRGKVVY